MSEPINGIDNLLRRESVFDDINRERARQDEKFGEHNHDDFVWAVVAGEEMGEVHQAVLHDRFGGKAAGTTYTEVLHLASVAVAWLEAMKRRSE